jgi:hypothetical protein
MIDKMVSSIVYLGTLASFLTLIWFPSYWVWVAIGWLLLYVMIPLIEIWTEDD